MRPKDMATWRCVFGGMVAANFTLLTPFLIQTIIYMSYVRRHMILRYTPGERIGQQVAVSPQAMLFTLYGDCILPRASETWVGAPIKLVAEFGQSEQLFTRLFARMSQKGWLKVNKVRRNSIFKDWFRVHEFDINNLRS